MDSFDTQVQPSGYVFAWLSYIVLFVTFAYG